MKTFFLRHVVSQKFKVGKNCQEMTDYSRNVVIEMIQILESLLVLTYETRLEPLLEIVTDVGIQAISTHVEGTGFEGPTRVYFESGSEK